MNLFGLFKHNRDKYWDDIESEVAALRKKQRQHAQQLQEAILRQRIAELANEMDFWWSYPSKGNKYDNKYHPSQHC